MNQPKRPTFLRTWLKPGEATLRPCEVCGIPFLPRYAEQRVSGSPCAKILGGRSGTKDKTTRMVAAAAERRAARRRAIEAEALQRFGVLTSREIGILNFGNLIGYKRGYNKARVAEQSTRRQLAACVTMPARRSA